MSRMGSLPLIPPPKSVRVTGGVVELPRGRLSVGVEGAAWTDVVPMAQIPTWEQAEAATAHVVVRVTGEGVDPRSTRGQSYRLEIHRRVEVPPLVRIESPSVAGARYGLATLRQIARCSRLGWPIHEMVIEDEPSFATRGVMLDISRDRVPTTEMLLEIVEHLAALKINHLQLYMEHTFAYEGHEEVWRHASPMTVADLGVLEMNAAEHGIELAANQNCFGHLTRWLELPRYAPLAETHGEWVFDNGEVRVPRSGPFSLCPTDPKSLDFVDGLLEQLLGLPLWSSRVNIGCDETFDVGTGRSRAEVERRGRAAVYAEYVNAVAAIVRKRLSPAVAGAARPMFWADIALRDPAALDLLDDDLTALVWGYEADAPFDAWCRAIRASRHGRREIWMCPGTSSWRSITGRTTERRGNLRAAARAGLAHGATGYLATEWGDHGHRQQWPIALHALADGASAAWNAPACDSFDARAAAIHLMGDRTGDLGLWLERLGDLDLPLRDGTSGERVRNATALFVDFHEPLAIAPHWGGDLGVWRMVGERLESLAASFPRVDDGRVGSELEHVLEVVRVAIDRAKLRRGADEIDRGAVLTRLERAVSEHRRLWLERSRPGGLDDSCRYYQQVVDELERSMQSVD